MLTRETDTYVDLYRRVRIARQADADLFISLHADAGADPATRGASVYTLSEQGATRAVREVTRSDDWHRDLHLPGRDPSVDRILLDMTQRATQNRSAQFARVLLTHLEAADHRCCAAATATPVWPCCWPPTCRPCCWRWASSPIPTTSGRSATRRSAAR